MDQQKVIVLGGGFSGLWLAARLIMKGYAVEVLEKEEEVGGLMKSVDLEDIVLDLGPHIYYPSNIHYYEKFLNEPLDRVWAY